MKNSFNEIIKSIFERALNLDRLSRDVFFNNLSDREKKYAEEVKSLLNAYEASQDFLEIESGGNIFSEYNIGSHPLIGKHIGSYLIEEEIGVGGMGIVFIGKRDDKQFEQRVAIKILKQGLTSEYLVKRFQKERQTLANLQHPNIAKLFDGGKTNEGLPYLVMEYIDGISITDYCSNKNISIEKKLDIFVKVCNAIQYAHQNLIVHRDIKPGNVLVDKEGRPKLLDFGVSKFLDEDFQTEGEVLTKTGTWHLTPEYASPEQIKGEEITTSSDIYSLGILLYRLLSGNVPYNIYNSSPLAISKILDEKKIVKPSKSVLNIITNKETLTKENLERSKKTYKLLKGDLDNIVLKAMHKDPTQRYTSANDLVIDINKYLTGLPVSARKDTVTYRVSKFIARHKVGFALFIIGNLLVIGSIIAIIHQKKIAINERDRATIELTKFEEINNFILEMLASADPAAEGRDVKVYDLLENATKEIDLKFKNNPKVKSAIQQTLGSTFIGLGEYKKAETLLKESLEANKILYGSNSIETAKSFHQLGLCYDWIGNFKLADSLYKNGIAIYEKDPIKPPKELANNLNDYGTLLTNLGEFDSSSTLLKRALSIYNNLGFIYIDNKNYVAAENSLEMAYKIILVLLGKNHPYVGLALINLGMLSYIKEEYQTGEAPLLKAIDLFYRTDSKKDPFLTLAYYWLGRIYLASNQLIKSEDVFTKCINIREEIYSENHSKIWSAKGELAICLFKQKKYLASENLLIGALNFYKGTKNPNMKKVKRHTEYSAILYKKIGDNSKAALYQTEFEKLNKDTNVK